MLSSRRSGWDLKQLQAFRQATFLEILNETSLSNHNNRTLVIDGFDLLDDQEQASIIKILQLKESRPAFKAIIIVWSGAESLLLRRLLHLATVSIECMPLEPMTKDIHGRITTTTISGGEVYVKKGLFRACEGYLSSVVQ